MVKCLYDMVKACRKRGLKLEMNILNNTLKETGENSESFATNEEAFTSLQIYFYDCSAWIMACKP